MAIEALNRFECYLVNTMADATAIADAVDHPMLGVHYDTHHMHIEEPDVTAALETARPHLKHVHVSENHRGTPGSGQVAWEETFRTLHGFGYDGWYTIEAFSRTDPAFANAIHVWREPYPDPLTLAREGAAFLRRTWEETRPA